MYGKNKYGLLQYARDSTPGSVQMDYYIELSQYVPQFIANITEIKEIYSTEGYELGILQNVFEDIFSQGFISTATWGLLRWEEVFGVTTNVSLSYEQRREIIMAKIRGQGTTTAEMIKDAAEAFSGGEVEVIEDNPNYHFIVRFIGIYGIPRNMQAFITMLEEIKPAHLWYTFDYKYVKWNDLKPKTWNDLRPYTWNGLRINEITPYVSWTGLQEEEYTWNSLAAYGWNKVKEIEEAKRICN
ncbi:DUF2313 domain-containing protein [Eisenbergiella tayi]|uniref:DUF2313 domain-containing protein n=1 Tax=Eisenbergiella porci TaxID=2652274 RepID=A0A6N7W803_9FIRM|nr:YmfQ family protein [Eisenbergiella porci]MSS91381.1 DUF2313 domain-containing protein [Eisenbergiella porci]